MTISFVCAYTVEQLLFERKSKFVERITVDGTIFSIKKQLLKYWAIMKPFYCANI